MNLNFKAGKEEFRVCVIEKSAEIGGHILSGKIKIYPNFLHCIFEKLLHLIQS